MKMSKISSIFQHPFVIIGAMITGVCTGIFAPKIGAFVQPFGDMFLSFLKMCLIPIIITSIAMSISKLFNKENDVGYSKRIVFYFSMIMVSVSSISLFMGILTQPGAEISGADSPKLQEIALSSSFINRTLDAAIEEQVQKSLVQFFTEAIPSNIFESLAKDNTFQVLIFAIILGVATSFLTADNQNKIHQFCDVTLTVFQKIINTVTLFLPFGVFCLMAGGISSLGTSSLIELLGFVTKVYLTFGLLFLLSTLVIRFKTGQSITNILSWLRTPLFIAFGTRNAVATIPATLEALENKFKLDSNITRLAVPLGAVLGRFGNIMYFSFATVFIAQLYNMSLSVEDCLLIIVGSIFAGINTSGATGAITLGMLSIVLDPLGLPFSAVLLLFIAVDPIIDPARTLMTIYPNVAATTLIAHKSKKGAAKEVSVEV